MKALVRSVVALQMFAGLLLGAGSFEVPTAWLYVGRAVFGALLNHALLSDHTLQSALEGYADYAARVRWRLLPGVY